MLKLFIRFLLRVNRITYDAMKKAVVKALIKIGEPVEFDWENESAPSYPSGAFQDDLTDVYITKIWLDRDLIKVNLHAYYIGEDLEDIDLNDDVCVDWEDLLDALYYKMLDKKM